MTTGEQVCVGFLPGFYPAERHVHSREIGLSNVEQISGNSISQHTLFPDQFQLGCCMMQDEYEAFLKTFFPGRRLAL